MNNFNEYAFYYNAFYDKKDYSTEAKVVAELIMKYWSRRGTPHSIINLGCGTGRHDMELSRLGYSVKGIDLSPNMIELAKQNTDSDRVSFEVGDVRTYRDGFRYDICCSLFHVMSYQNSNDDVLNSFKTAYSELIDSGIFIFDCWYGPGVLSEKPEVRVRKIKNAEKQYLRTAEPIMHVERNVVDVNYQVYVMDNISASVTNFSETHCMRYFFNPEIELILSMAGFSLLDCIDCNTLEKPTTNSWSVYFIARKE